MPFVAVRGFWKLYVPHCFAKYCCLILEGARPEEEPQEHLLDRSLQVCIFARNFLHPILNKTIECKANAKQIELQNSYLGFLRINIIKNK